MIVGKIVGSLVATRKNEKLIGSKFLIVEPIYTKEPSKDRFVAVDHIGAGIGDIVIVTTGSGARMCCNIENTPIDAAIIGIVDNGLGLE